MSELSLFSLSNEEKNKKNEQSLKNIWGTISHTNIYIYILLESEKEEGEEGVKRKYEEIMDKNFP